MSIYLQNGKCCLGANYWTETFSEEVLTIQIESNCANKLWWNIRNIDIEVLVCSDQYI